MLNSLRLRNLRSFSGDDNSPYVDLKPLTVLVGKNSSGKSSFLRSLPLLRQSVEVKTEGPILWYGPYIDFGAFSEAKAHGSEIDTIFFDFKLSTRLNQSDGLYWGYYRQASDNGRSSIEATVHIGVRESSKKTVTRYVKIIIDDIVYQINYEAAGRCSLWINDVQVLGADILLILNTSGLLPMVVRYEFEKDNPAKKKTIPNIDHEYIDEYFSEKLMELLKKYFHGSTSEKTITRGIANLGVYNKENVKSELENLFRGNNTFIQNLRKEEDLICNAVYELSMHKNLVFILRALNEDLVSTFKSVRYIAPLRATAERYYRYQDLQVNEMDHTGSNLAMILRSFSNPEKERFSKWTMSHFGFNVRVEETGLHYELKIQTDNDSREYNINDMGFGFSQMLPIIASIWIETSRPLRGMRRSPSKKLIFAIEQPELHLHPEYQSKLARLFAAVIKTAKDSNVNLVLIFETHSKTMIDTLGDCIEEDVITEEDVNIVLFQKECSVGSTEINFSKFDNDGFLEHWPVGFFSGRG